ncbi:DNA/RNA non-specific endonuclease [Bacillus alkalicellulosilyticus]|uniref:DNA/RNA non-specific endonuclease n=1 Tax=Alkalihalobacterium alkalicellulosilyticum TaxID=1912214 RepID=UPI001FEB27C7|nr:DNA/RNA non-specific endonuclease [Bacillus alkalicellulosilyticus]
MSLIDIRIKEILQANSQLEKQRSMITSARGNIKGVSNSLDRKIVARRNIGGRLDEVQRALHDIEQQLKALEKFMNQSMTAYSNNERKLVSLAKKYTLSRKSVKSKNWNAFKGIKVKFSAKKQKIRKSVAKTTKDITAIFRVLSTMYIKAKVKSVYNATINEPYNWNTQSTMLNTQNVKDDMSEYVFSNDYLMDKSQTSFPIDEEEALKRYLSDPTNLERKSFNASSDIERPAPHFEDYRKVLGNPNSKANMHTAGHLSNAVINFWADDVITLVDKEASIGDKALAAGFILVKPAKVVDKALDLNKARRLNNSSSPSNTPSTEPKTQLTDKRSTDVNSAQTSKTNGNNNGAKPYVNNPYNNKGELKPNIKYKSGEYNYSYETDNLGRISKFETDNLQLTKRENRLNHNPNTPGKQPGDHAGHLAGDRFGGSPELDNLVSQASNINLSQYKKLENQWAAALKETPPKQVTVNLEIKYHGNSTRPSSFNVHYEIDGERFIKDLFN